MSTTSIEWARNADGSAGQTWNPITGCSLVSPGCSQCYAMTMAARLEAMGQAKYAGLTKRVNGKAVWTGKVLTHDDALTIPLRKLKPTTWFVNSMSDLFHEGVPFEFVDKVFAVMALCPHHTFQVLTKRPERMAEYLSPDRWVKICDELYRCERESRDQKLRDWANKQQCDLENRTGECWPRRNVWLGTSVEDQKRADERIPHLRRCPAAIRFLSCEPLLEEFDLLHDNGLTGQDYLRGWNPHAGPEGANTSAVDWVIVGGESGPDARPCNVAWVRSIVHQCEQAGVACFVKQLGTRPIVESGTGDSRSLARPAAHRSKWADPAEWPEDLRVRELPRCPAAGAAAGGGL